MDTFASGGNAAAAHAAGAGAAGGVRLSVGGHRRSGRLGWPGESALDHELRLVISDETGLKRLLHPWKVACGHCQVCLL